MARNENGISKMLQQKLRVMQNRFLRIILGAYRATLTRLLHKELQIEDITEYGKRTAIAVMAAQRQRPDIS